MKYRNAKYIDARRIDCEIDHPVFGWAPYTLDPSDTDMTIDNDALLAAMNEAGDVAAYVAPDPEITLADERSSMVVSPAQIRLTLLHLGLLPTVQALADSDLSAAIVWEYASEIRRTDALIDALGNASFTPTQIDDIFRYAQSTVI